LNKSPKINSIKIGNEIGPKQYRKVFDLIELAVYHAEFLAAQTGTMPPLSAEVHLRSFFANFPRGIRDRETPKK